MWKEIEQKAEKNIFLLLFRCDGNKEKQSMVLNYLPEVCLVYVVFSEEQAL